MKQILSFRSFFIISIATAFGLAIYWQQSADDTPVSVFERSNEPILKQTPAQSVSKDLAVVGNAPKKRSIVPSQLSQKKEVTLHSTQLNPAISSNFEKDDISKENNERKSVGERWAAEFEMIKNPATGQIPKGVHQKGIGAAKKVRTLQLPPELSEDGLSLRTLPTITTTVRGPNNYGGRTRAIAFDKLNTQIMLAGGVSSGIFRSINGGGSWARVTPAGEIHTVTAIAQDPRVGQGANWYFGTGENSNSAGGSGAQYLGHGIWKSTDNGLTWAAITSTQGNLYSYDNDFDNINRIIIDPNSGAILVGAGETVKRSPDGGTTWENVVGDANAQSNPTDIIYNAVGGAFYAAIHGSAANTQGGVYRSTTGMMGTWTKIATPNDLNVGGVKRITLANVGNTANILVFYEVVTPLACVGGGTSEAGLKSYNPTTMAFVDHSQLISNCAGGTSNPKVIALQGGYNMCIATKPDDGNIVYLGGVEIYRLNLATSAYEYIGGDQGSANATNLHVDNHLLLFEPGSNVNLWAGNDGGLRKTDVTGAIAAGPTGGYSWTDRTSDYITYQYYRADINPTNGSDFLAGAAQDNAITLQPSTAIAKEIHGGDGTCIGVISGTDFNTYNVIVATQEGNISRINNGTTVDIKPTGQAQGFKTLFLLDADNTNHLYYPTNTKKLYRTRNAVALADGTIGDVATNWEEITGIAATLSGNISALSTSRNVGMGNAAYTASNTNRKMYIGTDNGKVYRFADPAFAAIANTPIDITPGGATGFVSDVISNPYDDKEVLVTYSNYGVPSVWHTTDASAATPTWVNVEGAAGSAVELASARSAMIVRAGSTVVYVVGTSTGLYGTTALSGATTVWERISPNDIALSPAVSLRLRPIDNKMVLGTHGNGLFMLAFPAAVLPLDLLSFIAKKNTSNVQLNWESANEVNVSHYNVQQSDDGKNFAFFTKVKAKGASTYQTVDDNPSAGVNYYRLEMVDMDGKKQYSKIVNVTFDTKGTKMSLYPNPTQGNTLTIDMSVNSDSEILFIVTDISGKNRLVSQQKTAQGNTQLSLDISILEDGIYFITAKNVITNEVFKSMRFIKQ
jgi:Secretion system C-terminal sorting domain